MTEIRYPHVHVKLTGTDGNAYAMIGKVQNALRRANVPPAEVKQFAIAAMDQHSYDDLMRFLTQIVDVQ